MAKIQQESQYFNDMEFFFAATYQWIRNKRFVFSIIYSKLFGIFSYFYNKQNKQKNIQHDNRVQHTNSEDNDKFQILNTPVFANALNHLLRTVEFVLSNIVMRKRGIKKI